MADTSDSNSLAARRVGSTPTSGTPKGQHSSMSLKKRVTECGDSLLIPLRINGHRPPL